MTEDRKAKRRTRGPRQARTALIVSVGLVALWRLAPRPSILLSRSVAVYQPGDFTYQWLSDRELLLIKPFGPNGARATSGFAVPGGPGAYGWQFLRRDVSTGIETPLMPPITGFPHRSEAPYNAAVSPDGRWLLWRDRLKLVAVQLDGMLRRTWDDSNNPENCIEVRVDPPHWLRDSRHFCELLTRHVDNLNQDEYVGAVLIRDVDDPKSAQVVELPHVAEFGDNVYFESPHVTLNGDVFAAAPKSEQSANKTLLLAPMQAGKPTRKLRIHAPKGMEFTTGWSDNYTAVALSPRGDLIAWNCVSPSSVPPLQDLLHRILPGQNGLPQRTLSVWISRLDGSDMSELGETVITGNDNDLKVNGITNLRWLPSGKALSFEYRGTLYRVSVN